MLLWSGDWRGYFQHGNWTEDDDYRVVVGYGGRLYVWLNKSVLEYNPSGERAGRSRYSMPFFLHLRSDFRFQTLPQCVTAQNPDRYPVPITADDYLQERLREIGLKK